MVETGPMLAAAPVAGLAAYCVCHVLAARLLGSRSPYPALAVGSICGLVVAVALSCLGVRGTGAGRLLVAEGVRRIDETWPGQANRISAQAHLADFYCGFGYTVQGDTYLEDGIPHVEMLRAAMGGYPAQRSQGGGPG